VVPTELRIVIASYGAPQFRLLHETVTAVGHVPAAYLMSRSMRPSRTAEPDLVEATKAVVADVPAGMDLLLPGSVRALPALLAACRPDVLLVFGFNWRLPSDVLVVPRLGALNVHPSTLPKYRGPSPVLWAIRNGDPCMGLTVHRVTDRIDAGPILAQVADLPLPDRVTSADVWELQQAALPALIRQALERAVHGDPGTPQDEEQATYAGFPPPDWYTVQWQGSRHSVHNQIRVLRYLRRGEGPVVELHGNTMQVKRTSLTDDGGSRIECPDGPLWVTFAPVALGETCLGCSSQAGCAAIRERLEQGKCGRELLTTGASVAEHLFAVGKVEGGQGFLPTVAEFTVHASCLTVEVGRALGVAAREQYLARAVEGGRFTTVVPDLAFQRGSHPAAVHGFGQFAGSQVHPCRLDEPPGFPHPVAGLLRYSQRPVNRCLRGREVSPKPFCPSEQPEGVAFIGRVTSISEELRQGPDRLQSRRHVISFELSFRTVHPAQPFPVRVLARPRTVGRVREVNDRMRQFSRAQADESEGVQRPADTLLITQLLTNGECPGMAGLGFAERAAPEQEPSPDIQRGGERGVVIEHFGGSHSRGAVYIPVGEREVLSMDGIQHHGEFPGSPGQAGLQRALHVRQEIWPLKVKPLKRGGRRFQCQWRWPFRGRHIHQETVTRRQQLSRSRSACYVPAQHPVERVAAHCLSVGRAGLVEGIGAEQVMEFVAVRPARLDQERTEQDVQGSAGTSLGHA
jgi:methionyl-tRNA formyltransferase